MDYDPAREMSISVSIMKPVSILLGLSYLLIGSLKIIHSAGLVELDHLMISDDIVAGIVMVFVSIIFFMGLFKTNRIRAYLFVGSLLGMMVGLTQILIALARILSDIMANGWDSISAGGFAEPSILLAIMIVLVAMILGLSNNIKDRHK